MSEAKAAPKRSLYEWSFRYRRVNVLRAIRRQDLSPAAKQVMVALAVRDDDPFVLPERPPVGALVRHLALAERTVRQAVAELVERGCLSFTGQFYHPGEEAADVTDRPDLARQQAFFRHAHALPSRAEYVGMLERLRDRAVAARRLATAVSAERALGRALGIGAKPLRGTDAPPEVPADAMEVELGPPHDALKEVDLINADRALAPAARHAAIELLLDPVDDPMGRPDDDDFYWSERLAGRLGLTTRGARKALLELEGLGLIAHDRSKRHGRDRVMPGSEICIYPGYIVERARRGTDAPRLLVPAGVDPVHAHVIRLERLRDLAGEEGLVSTALVAHRAIGRALDFIEMKPAPVEEREAPPVPAPAPPRIDVLPFVRRLLDADPEMGPVIRDVIAEIRSAPPGHATAQAAE